MTDVDTSSYLKPTQSNFNDIVLKYQQLEQNKIGIDQNKLKLANERLTMLAKGVSSLIHDPDLTGEKVVNQAQYMAKQLGIPPDMTQHFISQFPTQGTKEQLQVGLNEVVAQALHMTDSLNYAYGVPNFQNNNQQIIPGRTSQNPLKPAFQRSGQPIQMQIPPTQGVVDPDNPTAPTRALGPQAEQPTPGGLPVSRGGVNLTGPNRDVTAVNGMPVQPYGTPRGPVVGQGPGIAEAETLAGGASGQQLADARKRSASFQRDIFPLVKAIPALEELGTKGTGPGTEAINHIKSIILSNVPGITENTPGFKSIKTYDEAKKYLVDAVNQIANTSASTNDKLAAAFAGNPSVHISNAAAHDVAKSMLALRRMDQAITQEFDSKSLPSSQFSRWVARRTNEIDPRAFGIDMMKPEARTKLLEQLKKNPAEFKRFEQSAQLGVSLGFIKP